MSLLAYHDDMEAVNRYFMEQVKVKTPAAEKLKKEWMVWWKENKRGWTGYTQEQWDIVRNKKHAFDRANAVTSADKAAAVTQQTSGLTSEELRGETKRAGSDGEFVEPETPLIPTGWKVGAGVAVGLIAIGVFGKKLLGLTPLGRLAKFLP